MDCSNATQWNLLLIILIMLHSKIEKVCLGAFLGRCI